MRRSMARRPAGRSASPCVPEPPGGGTDPAVAAAVRRAAAALADAGYEVVDASVRRCTRTRSSCWLRLILGDFALGAAAAAPLMGDRRGGIPEEAATSA